MLQFMELQGAGHDLVTEPQQDRPCILYVFVVCELTLEGRTSPWFHFGWEHAQWVTQILPKNGGTAQEN